ncbi:NAD-dependent epimerase/dehydratase family protein [Brevibacillus daliensis]|uniref:NAD-dependent epimerase/dehydratase family protein n=1 Tax=Brevibacillus daliensis TaxID=2892995 RepID=UPI001E3C6161|nr:NAD-dependent epimerase/dehydratase family protein [Brevibacillus daliensis]
MKVLVTGGSGLVGGHTVEFLLQSGFEVVVVDQVRSDAIREDRITFYQADICVDDLTDIFYEEKPDFVIHLAAQVSVQRSLTEPHLDAKLNILGTIQVLRQCVAHNVQKIVFASSAAVYGEPTCSVISEDHESVPASFYGISKITAENYIKMFSKEYGLNYAILRYANIYGMPRNGGRAAGVVSIFLENIRNDSPTVIYGDGEQTRDFIFVKDIAQANVAALLRGDRETFNVSSNSPTTINQLFYTITEMMEVERHPQYMSKKSGENQYSLLNNAHAKEILLWEAKWALVDGVREIIERQRIAIY